MKISAIFAALIACTAAAPTNVDPATPAIVTGGVLAQIAALPLLGPLWMNAAISANRPTNTSTTPPGFAPIAVSSGKDIWGAKQSSIPIFISYARMPANQTVERTLIGVWADRNNWPDGKVSAINLDASYANTTFPSNVTVFTREFSCATGDRLNPTERAYLFIKTRDNEGKKNDIMSDRFTMIDNRNTANAASAFYTIQCLYVGDKLGVRLPVRKESDMHSDNLPATSDKLF